MFLVSVGQNVEERVLPILTQNRRPIENPSATDEAATKDVLSGLSTSYHPQKVANASIVPAYNDPVNRGGTVLGEVCPPSRLAGGTFLEEVRSQALIGDAPALTLGAAGTSPQFSSALCAMRFSASSAHLSRPEVS